MVRRHPYRFMDTQETADLPESWGTLVTVRLGLRPRQDRHARPYGVPTRPPVGQRRGLPQENFRGSMSRLSVWPSTLRRVGRPTAAQDSLPAAGQLYRAGFGPAGFRRKVFEL